jgi:hypothetical protein
MLKKLSLSLFLTLYSSHLVAGEGIPEPMLFDMIRPLDSKKGELEINTLAHKSYEAKNTKRSLDPFGSGATTRDNEKIEWAPEIEYAVSDGFALEFELPMEGSELEAYKFGAQYTFGRVNESYIHGVQVLLEPNKDLEKYNTTVLYLGGYRFDETFSTLFMLGGRIDLEGNDKSDSFEFLANGSVFAQLNHAFVLGLETNYSRFQDGGDYALTLVPQIHYEANDNIELQAGLSFGEASYSREKAFVFRAIYCF